MTQRDLEIEALIALCDKSLKAFCHLVLPHRFGREFSYSHEQFFEVIDDETVRKVLILAHRGWGKSTLVNFALPIQRLALKKSLFVVPTSATSALAEQRSEDIKHEFLENKVLWSLIGNPQSQQFAVEKWRLSSGGVVLPRSFGQQVRGLLEYGVRPDLPICDDLEAQANMMSKEQRLKVKEWFFADYINIVDNSITGNYRHIVVGTIEHQASLLEDLRHAPDWAVLDFPLCDETYHSYWPSFMSDADCLAKRKQFDAFPHLFEMEYRNRCTSPESALFKRDQFRYLGPDEVPRWDQMETFVVCDPAKSTDTFSDYTAIIAVSIDLEGNRIYHRETIRKKLHPWEIWDQVFCLADKYNTLHIGYEDSGLKEFAQWGIVNEMLRRGKNYELTVLKPRYGMANFDIKTGKKHARIASLAPLYQLNMIYHCGNYEDLESELMDFPRSSHDDVADAMAYLIQMCYEGELFMDLVADAARTGEKLAKAMDAPLDSTPRQGRLFAEVNRSGQNLLQCLDMFPEDERGDPEEWYDELEREDEDDDKALCGMGAEAMM